MTDIPKKITKKYSNGEVTVVWQPHKCIHSEICFHGLPGVFNPEQRPWVNVEASDTETIVNQIKRCPSGALSYFMDAEGEPSETSDSGDGKFTERTQPAGVSLEEGKTYAWCSCGLSDNQPFCDGSHKTTDKTPVVFKCEEAGTKYLCMCKKTNNAPYCDGSHAG